ncbi:hypothetical protein RJ640_029515 [Escallonia rubra]|uniref:Uncharacterized protein n=1 Tax=Escallonia rubra TaxID=112253 RepID=A0AA88S2G0_9ASTE|nr:hypothetical protein RJ640_029515 [Escallonia rubra]
MTEDRTQDQSLETATMEPNRLAGKKIKLSTGYDKPVASITSSGPGDQRLRTILGVQMHRFCTNNHASYCSASRKLVDDYAELSYISLICSTMSTLTEISDLEGQLLALRNLLSTRAALINGLVDGVLVDSLFAGPERSMKEDNFNMEEREPSKIEKWLA